MLSMKSLIWGLLSFCFFSRLVRALIMCSPDPVSGNCPSGSLIDSGGGADGTGRVYARSFKSPLNTAVAGPIVNYRFDEARCVDVASCSIETQVRSL